MKYSGRKLIEMNSEKELYKSLVSVMMIGLKQNIPYLIKPGPVVKPERNWLKTEILNCTELLVENKFFLRGIVCDNHTSNVLAFFEIICEYERDNESLSFEKGLIKNYLFYDSVHLIKNIWNNLLNR